MSENPSAAELLGIIERARSDRVQREALDRFWAAVAVTAPKPSEWPCASSRECMASRHEKSCPISIAETLTTNKRKRAGEQ